MADNYPLDNAELTPETREETFLDGVTELEPETRKEAFIAKIYDSSQVVPEHIETREEWFLNKAAEGGGGVTIEALSVTANGTYSEAGKAYSPVTVNVPLPTNANERKSVTSYPVTDSANYPLPKCDVTVTDADKCEVIVTTDNTITEDSGVYIERQSGGGNRELDAIVGGSVVWNQLFSSTASGTINGIIKAFNSTTGLIELSGEATTTYAELFGKISPIQGRKYAILISVKENPNSIDFRIGSLNTNVNNLISAGSTVVSANNSYNNSGIGVQSYSVGTDFTGMKLKLAIIDLTDVFGSTIADYIYSLEQSTAGSGIAWLKSYGYLTEDYYGYTANKIESVSVARHITRGVNQWDEQWEVGMYNISDGSKTSASTVIRSKNPIRVIPNIAYYKNVPTGVAMQIYKFDANMRYLGYEPYTSYGTFTADSDTHYINFNLNTVYGTTYKNDICINISNPSKNGTYEPYEEHTYPINPITLRGIPKLNASNQLYYDGDRYEASGRVTRKYNIANLGALNWSYSNSRFNTTTAISDIKTSATDYSSFIICDKYEASQTPITTQDKDKTIATYNGYIYIKDSAYNDAASFKAAMSGVYLVYEKATPTTESTSPFEANQIVDANGTEEYIDAGVDAGSRDVAIPVGHDTKYFNGKAYVKPLTAGTPDTISLADMGIMPTSPMYISANGSVDVEYWKSNS